MKDHHFISRRVIKRSGIYQIINEINGKSYVGSSIDIDNRWDQHRRSFKKPTKNRSLLWSAVSKYGIENFTFLILEESEPIKEILLAREQHYIDALKPVYNLMPNAGSRLGSKQSEETNRKVGEASRRRWEEMSPQEYAEVCSHMGYNPTEEQCTARSERMRQWAADHPDVTADKIANMMAGLTPEIRTETMRRTARRLWDKDRDKMMEAIANRVTSPEGKARQREGCLKWNEQNPGKRSEVSKANWTDPEIRKKMLNAPARLAAVKAAWADPEKRKRMSASKYHRH